MKSDLFVVLIAIMVAAVVLAIDQVVPLGVAGGVPYVFAVAVAVLSSRPRLVVGIALLCTLLVCIGFVASPGPGATELWKVVVNRFLAVLAIWAVAAVGLHRQRLVKTFDDSNPESTEDTARFKSTPLRKIHHEPIVWIFASLFFVAGGILVAHQWRVGRDLVQASALQGAKAYSNTLTAFRSLYTSEVVEPARQSGIVVKHDYSVAAGEIPLPATLSMKLSETVGNSGSGIRSRLVSPFPFPGRGKVGEHRDEFARQAWEALTKNPDEPYIEEEYVDGEWTLRYATADVMRKSCIGCHNRHPETPKDDWVEGDVRGVLEVDVPIDRVATESATGIRQSLTLFGLFGAVSLGSVALVVTRLRRDSAQLEQRVSERTQELTQANNALVKSNQDLDDFAYIASHDLKEPLRGIANYSMFLAEDYGDVLDDNGRSKLDTLNQLSGRMEELINSLLKFSRVGRAELSVLPTDLNEVVAEVCDLLKLSLEEQSIEVRIPRSLPVIECDAVRVRELFNNLISNAIKYNDKAEKWIEISFDERFVENDGDLRQHVFWVRDNGIGIREKHLVSVFRIFRRLHGRDKFGGGSGAGLTFAKQIVERHGGKIWIESTYGEGTTFYFTLTGNF